MADTATVEQENNGTVTESQERTFTQAELDEIVKSRVAKERAKFSDFETLQKKAQKFDEMEEASKSELQKATERAEALQKQIDSMTHDNDVRLVREKVSKETGVPMNLLSAETEEDCMAQAQGILEYKNSANVSNYPSVKDGGEVQNLAQKKTTAEQFADWFASNLTE
ncbi:MAG: hypothetical protein KBT03_10825 [Bacteroidales bacterium]|nr:hypothetical protein [Candidatus Scybalousia scybalohippi]